MEVVSGGLNDAGFVDSADGHLTLTDVTLRGNTFTHAPLRCIDGGTLVLEGVAVTDNLGNDEAGGVFASDCTVSITDSVFEANRSVHGAGALWMEGSPLTLSGVTFTDNQGAAAAVVTDSPLSCEGVSFAGNSPTDLSTSSESDCSSR